jgi:hypothetical protein
MAPNIWRDYSMTPNIRVSISEMSPKRDDRAKYLARLLKFAQSRQIIAYLLAKFFRALIFLDLSDVLL